ncbi:MAG: hypothetical protein PHV24_03940 [Candidatus Kapabacteria bacterium]|nr:hypothetical protein [Candidatus Kapabacteria bacterium]
MNYNEKTQNALNERKINYDMFRMKLCAIGYLLQKYQDPTETKAMILCDAESGEGGEANGRTGKGLLVEAVSKFVPTVKVNGKAWEPRKDKFAFSQMRLGARVFAVDDCKQNFSLEPLFSILTEGMQVERKGQNSFRIPREDSPKFVLTMNGVMTTGGASERARRYEVPFSDFYNDRFTPKDRFGAIFFEDWSEEEWNKFDNFMLNCVGYFMVGGFAMPAKDVLNSRKVKDLCFYSTELEEEFNRIAHELKNGRFIKSAEVKERIANASDGMQEAQRKLLTPMRIAQILGAIVPVKSIRRHENGIMVRGFAVD